MIEPPIFWYPQYWDDQCYQIVGDTHKLLGSCWCPSSRPTTPPPRPGSETGRPGRSAALTTARVRCSTTASGTAAAGYAATTTASSPRSRNGAPQARPSSDAAQASTAATSSPFST